MAADPAQLRRALASSLSVEDPAWRDAVAAVPREHFLDDTVFRPSPAGWQPVSRETAGVDEWLRLAYEDTTRVTQVDGVGAAQAQGPLTGTPTSSSTLPSLVVHLPDLAGLREGDTVLEIGTGTGCSAAVLCHRLGEKNVYSVECDPQLAATAAEHLRAVGYAPTLVTGDGLAGYRDAADYDAIVATCSVRYIPPTWLYQVTPGEASSPRSVDGCWVPG
ncbi:methyltransferase domain-containing protein [Streptomyces sp. KHY 26]|uniref:methyltransferase domain-containing protein n=1 Tax=Streptomyces sp. KHY 26 TaxID=3097359 RepID=UPI00376F3C6E